MLYWFLIVIVSSSISHAFAVFEVERRDKGVAFAMPTKRNALWDSTEYYRNLDDFFSLLDTHPEKSLLIDSEAKQKIPEVRFRENVVAFTRHHPAFLLDECLDKTCRLALGSKNRELFLAMLHYQVKKMPFKEVRIADYGSGGLRFLLRCLRAIAREKKIGAELVSIDPAYAPLLAYARRSENAIIDLDDIPGPVIVSAMRVMQFLYLANFLSPSKVVLYLYENTLDYGADIHLRKFPQADVITAFDYATLTNPQSYARVEIDLLLGGIALRPHGILFDACPNYPENKAFRLQGKISEDFNKYFSEVVKLFENRTIKRTFHTTSYFRKIARQERIDYSTLFAALKETLKLLKERDCIAE